VGNAEDRIERTAERRMDNLDARLMNGTLTQQEYEARVKELNQWTKDSYAFARFEREDRNA
jgi:hypothetical protein